VTKTRMAAVLVTALCGLVGCARSTPAPEAPAGEEQPVELAGQTSPPLVAPTPIAEAPPPPPPPPATPLTGEQTQAMYEACWGFFNERKWDEFGQCYAEDAVAMEAGNPETHRGRAEIVEKQAKALATAFPDGKGELQLTLIDGKQVASVVLFRGTHTGPLVTPMGDMPATNKKVGFLLAQHLVLNDQNKVGKEWLVYDAPTLLGQIGKGQGKSRKVISKGVAKPVVELAKADETEKTNLANHAAAYEQFNKHDAKMFDFFASDVVGSDATAPRDCVGKAACKKALSSLWKAFSDARIESQGLWGAGSHTVSIGHVKGTNDGDMPEMGLKKTGKATDVFYVEFVEWKDGKIKKTYPFSNGLEIALQLGLVPEPGTAPAQAPGGDKPEKTGTTPQKSEARGPEQKLFPEATGPRAKKLAPEASAASPAPAPR
jgi:predicted ester cyclase